MKAITVEQVRQMEQKLADGGLVIFPTDTVYGLGCNPESRGAGERLYDLKRRELSKPSAVLFFELERAFETFNELGPQTRSALQQLLPGALTVLLPNPRQLFPLACGANPTTVGLRVPKLLGCFEALAFIKKPLLQSSANLAGGHDPALLEDVLPQIRDTVDLELDGGELPGCPSTVIDLRKYEDDGHWEMVRVTGAFSEARLEKVLGKT